MSPPPVGWRRRHGSAQGWGVTADTPAPITVRALAARDAVFGQLPHVCGAELDDLWRRSRDADVNLDAAVRAWTTTHRLNAPWLVARLVDGLTHGAMVTDLANPRLWWDRADVECARRAVPILALAEGLALAAHTATEDWPVLHEIGADPANETLDQFLGRARTHYRACAAVVEAAALDRWPLAREHTRDAGWLLRHRVKREPYAAIARADLAGCQDGTDRVRKAIRRLAATAGL